MNHTTMHTIYQDGKDLDDMLVVRHLSPRAPGETLRQAIDRIINWEVMVNLDPAVSSAAQALVDKGRDAALLSVIHRLNQNPYSLTKSECIHVVREMGPSSSGGHLAQDLDKGLFNALARDPNAKQHVRDAAEGINDLRNAKWLDPQCAERGACQSLVFKAAASEPIAEVMPGWSLAWVGREPIAQLLAKHPGVRIGTKLYTSPPPAVMENKPVQVWCDTCDGSGIVYQEGQRGVVGSGGDHPCPDCDGKGFNVLQYAKAVAPRQPLTDEQIVAALEAVGLNLAFRSFEHDLECARAVERAHGIGAKS